MWRVSHAAHGDGETEREYEIAKGDVTAGLYQRLCHTVAIHGRRLEHPLAFEFDAVLLQSSKGIGSQEVFEAVAVADLGDFDRLADAAGVAPIVAPPGDDLIELGAPHAEGVHLTVILAVQLERLLKIAVGALAADPKVLPQKVGLGGVIAGRRPQADA